MKVVKGLAIGIAFILLSSCAKTPDNYCRDTRVMVRTAGAAQVGTRSSSSTPGHRYSMGDGLVLEESVSDYGFEGDGQTRGAAITTDGYNKINANGCRFNIEGWLGPDINTAPYSSEEDKANHHFLSDSPRCDGAKWNFNSEHFWRNGISTTFWSYHVPEGGVVPAFTWPGTNPTAVQLENLNFTYTLPASSGNDDDAYNSKDLLIAYNKETRTVNNGILEMTSGTGEASYKNSINIKFHHPLSAIKFKVGSISGDSTPSGNEYVRITKVELVGVKTSGSFTAAGVAPNGCTVTCNSTSGSATYSQAATRAEIEGGKFTDAASEFVFFMIPQDLSGVKAKLTMVRKKKIITYESDGKTIRSTSYGEDITFTREVILAGSWAPGYYYTYSINSTVYFGGEQVQMDKEKIQVSDPTKITVNDDGSFDFSVGGKTGFNEWVSPLPTKGVNIIKLTFTHSYKNSSQKSARKIWLENASINPDWSGNPEDTTQFINPLGIKTYNADLVNEAKTLPSASTYWGSPVYYTGYLGDFTEGGGKYSSTLHDNNMNGKGEYSDIESVMYFYLGGQFDYVKIHFDYFGDAGDGKWTARVPIFNITEVVE